MAAYRADLKRQLLRFRVLNIAVGSRVNISDDEVRAYYERHMKDGSNVQVRASHVFVAIPEGADAAAAAEKQAQAQKILERAQAGEDFAKLARETSDDAATRADGGDLGYFGKDMLPKAIEELVFSMKVGDVRGPIRVDRGFHVIKLVDRKVKDPKPFDEVKDDIRMQLRQKDMERQTKIYLGRAAQEDAGRHPLLRPAPCASPSLQREAVDVEGGRRGAGACAAAVELQPVEHDLLRIEATARIGRSSGGSSPSRSPATASPARRSRCCRRARS